MINDLIRERIRLNEVLKQLKIECKKMNNEAKDFKGSIECKMKGKYSQYYIDKQYVRNYELYKIIPKVVYDFDRGIIPLIEKEISVITKAINILSEKPSEMYYSRQALARKSMIKEHSIYKSKQQIIQEFENQVVPEYEAYPIDTEIYILFLKK